MPILKRIDPIARTLHETLGLFNPIVGHYYPSVRTRHWRTAFIHAKDVLRATYYPIYRTIRFDRIAINITKAGAAGARIRLGVYKDDGFFRPGDLLVDAGEVSAEAVSAEAWRPIDLILRPGRYWLASLTNDDTVEVGAWETFLPLSVNPASLELTFGHIAQKFSYNSLPSKFTFGWYAINAMNIHMRVREVIA